MVTPLSINGFLIRGQILQVGRLVTVIVVVVGIVWPVVRFRDESIERVYTGRRRRRRNLSSGIDIVLVQIFQLDLDFNLKSLSGQLHFTRERGKEREATKDEDVHPT